jgi:hypothetical protein
MRVRLTSQHRLSNVSEPLHRRQHDLRLGEVRMSDVGLTPAYHRGLSVLTVARSFGCH